MPGANFSHDAIILREALRAVQSIHGYQFSPVLIREYLFGQLWTVYVFGRKVAAPQDEHKGLAPESGSPANSPAARAASVASPGLAAYASADAGLDSSTARSRSFTPTSAVTDTEDMRADDIIIAKVTFSLSALQEQAYTLNYLSSQPRGKELLASPFAIYEFSHTLAVALFKGGFQQLYRIPEPLSIFQRAVTQAACNYFDQGLPAMSSASASAHALVHEEHADSVQEQLCFDVVDGTPTQESLTRAYAQIEDKVAAFAPMKLVEFLDYAINLCERMAFIHQHQVTHLAIRPGSFDFDASGRLRLLNIGYDTYGPFALLPKHSKLSDLWSHGSMGIYFSPEQTGRTQYQPDHHTDIYSMGIYFYVILAGKAPWDGDTLEIFQSAISKPIPDISKLRPDLPEIISRVLWCMTEKSPNARYQSFTGILTDMMMMKEQLCENNGQASQLKGPLTLGSVDELSEFSMPNILVGRDNERQLIVNYVNKFCSSRSESNDLDTPTDTEPGGKEGEIEKYSEPAEQEDDASSRASVTTESIRTGSGGAIGRTNGNSQAQVYASDICDVLLLQGEEGSGKSSLLRRVKSDIQTHTCCVLHKFESTNSQPFMTLIACARTVLRYLLTESEPVVRAYCDLFFSISGYSLAQLNQILDTLPELKSVVSRYSSQSKRPWPTTSSGAASAESSATSVPQKPAQSPMAQASGSESARESFMSNDSSGADDATSSIARAASTDSSSTTNSALTGLNNAEPSHTAATGGSTSSITSSYASSVTRGAKTRGKRQTELDGSRGGDLGMRLSHLLRDVFLAFARIRNFVMMLDGLEHADRLSLGLLRMILSSRINMVLILTMPINMDASLVFKTAHAEGIRVHRLVIQTLSRESVEEFLSETLRRPCGAFNTLIDEITTKSGGYPLKVKEIIFSLYQNRCFYFDSSLKRWEVDEMSALKLLQNTDTGEPHLNQETPITALSPMARELAEIMSVLGVSVNIDVLGDFFRTARKSPIDLRESPAPLLNTPSSVLASVQEAMRLNIVAPTSEGKRYVFTQDQYRQRLLGNIAQDVLCYYHHICAELFMVNEQKSVNLPRHISNALNYITQLAVRRPYRDALVSACSDLNVSKSSRLEAAKLAMKLLQDSPWDANALDVDIKETFSIYLMLAESLFWSAHYDEARQYCQEMLKQKLDVHMRTETLFLLGRVSFAQAQFWDNIACLREVFQINNGSELVISDPETQRREMESMLEQLVTLDIQSMPTIVDESKLVCVEALVELVMSSLGIDPSYVRQCVIECAHSLLFDGYHPSIGLILILFASSCQTGSLEQRIRLSEHGYERILNDEDDAETDEAAEITKARGSLVHFMHLGSMTSSYEEKIQGMNNGKITAIHAGDRVYAGLILANTVLTKLVHGEQLGTVEEQCKLAEKAIEGMADNESDLIPIRSIMALIQALRDETVDNSILYRLVDEKSVVMSAMFPEQFKFWSGSLFIIACNALALYDDAVRHGTELLQVLYAHLPNYISVTAIFHFAMSCSAKLMSDSGLQPSSEEESARLREHIQMALSVLSEYAHVASNPKCRIWEVILRAEWLAIQFDVSSVHEYELAIELAHGYGYTIDEALIIERYSMHLMRSNMRQAGLSMAQSAIKAYSAAGAERKAHLMAKSMGLLGNFSLPHLKDVATQTYSLGSHEYQAGSIDYYRQSLVPDSHSDALEIQSYAAPSVMTMHNPRPLVESSVDVDKSNKKNVQEDENSLYALDALDLRSIIKFSHVISSEIGIEALLKKMLRLILSNSIGDYAAIIVKDEVKFLVTATGTQSSANTYNPPEPFTEADELVPSRVINSVIHGAGAIFLTNSRDDERFVDNPWFRKHGDKSFLALPIKHKMSLVGVLYLQGPVDGFHGRLLTFLSLLCEQIGTNITNALLFKSVQKATLTNVKMIQSQEKALKAAKAAELKYLALLETIPCIVFTANSETGKIDYLNAFWWKYAGVDAPSFENDKWLEVVHPDDRDLIYRRIHEASDARQFPETEIRLRNSAGQYRYHMSRMTGLFDGRGNKSMGIGFCIDINDQKEAREHALRAMKLKASFLANMSHELRTPFSGFYGMLNLLSDTQLNYEQRDLVQTAKSSCEMLLQIIDDLLNFSKLEAGKMSVMPYTVFSVEDMLSECIELLQPLTAKKNIEIGLQIDTAIPPYLAVDINKVKQILTNLLGNAVKFTLKGYCYVTCSLVSEGTTEDECMLHFIVEDTGIGISKSDMKHLFKPFSQVDASTTRTYGGTGLGLSISMELCRLLGGDMGVESEEGHGSRFWFRLKFEKPKDLPQDIVSRISQLKLNEEAIRGKRIALVTNSKLMLPSFRAAKLDIEFTAFQALEGLKEAMGKTSFDAIVADLEQIHDIEQFGGMFADETFRGCRILWIYNPFLVSHDWAPEYDLKLQEYQTKYDQVLLRMPKQPRITRTVEKLAVLLTGEKRVEEIYSSARVTHSRETGEELEEEDLAFLKDKIALVAEDNSVAQKLLTKQLTNLGMRVEACWNGAEAVNLFRSRDVGYYSIFFVDQHMPVCDGIEATQAIRKFEKSGQVQSHLPIIALSADIQDSAQEMCKRIGMDAYLTKPLLKTALHHALKHYVMGT